MKHGIVIPCYNEAERIDCESFIQFLKRTRQYEICFVNDGSKDHTLEVLHYIRKSANTNNVYIYDLPQNGGKAEAVRQGSLFLEDHTSLNTIGFLDADLSTSLEEYADLCKTMEHSNGKLQLVFGSRNLESDGVIRNPIRNILSIIVGFLISLIVKVKITDTQCGAKVFHRSIIPIAFKKSFISKWLFDIEIILRLMKKLGKDQFLEIFKEHALNSWTHVEGSKLGARDSLRIPLNLFEIWSSYELMPILSVLVHLRLPETALRVNRFSSTSNGMREIPLNPYYKLNSAA